MNEYRIYLAEATPNTWYSVVEGVESVLSKGRLSFSLILMEVRNTTSYQTKDVMRMLVFLSLKTMLGI